jgi:hypothetical protein
MKEGITVAKFIAVHSVAKTALEYLVKAPTEQLKLDTNMTNMLKHCGPDAYFVRQWLVPALGKIFCEWNAKDEQSIRKVLDTYKGLPIDAIAEMRIVDGEDYRAR